jgi:RHS repeat-associated protein
MAGEEAFQYPGKLMDVVDGLYYEGARCYDPATGRFITEELRGGDATGPHVTRPLQVRHGQPDEDRGCQLYGLVPEHPSGCPSPGRGQGFETPILANPDSCLFRQTEHILSYLAGPEGMQLIN